MCSGIWSVATTRIGFWTWMWSTRLDWDRKWLADFNAGKTQLTSFDQSNKIVPDDVKTDGSVLLWKNYLLKCWCCVSLLNQIRVLELSLLLKLPSRKLELSFSLWSSFLLRFLCISINLPYDLAWNTAIWVCAPSCYLEMLDKLQKLLWGTVGHSFAAS